MSTPLRNGIVPAGAYVAVDTQTLIWGGLRRGVPGSPATRLEDAEKEKRSRDLLSDLEDAKAKLIVPSVVVAELLLPIHQEHHSNFVAIASQRFFCPPFDLASTALAAKLWQYGRTLPPEEIGGRWAVLKADAMIVATAQVHGARYFYSDDRRARNMAERAGMTSRPLPTHSLNLFPSDDPDEHSLLR